MSEKGEKDGTTTEKTPPSTYHFDYSPRGLHMTSTPRPLSQTELEAGASSSSRPNEEELASPKWSSAAEDSPFSPARAESRLSAEFFVLSFPSPSQLSKELICRSDGLLAVPERRSSRSAVSRLSQTVILLDDDDDDDDDALAEEDEDDGDDEDDGGATPSSSTVKAPPKNRSREWRRKNEKPLEAREDAQHITEWDQPPTEAELNAARRRAAIYFGGMLARSTSMARSDRSHRTTSGSESLFNREGYGYANTTGGGGGGAGIPPLPRPRRIIYDDSDDPGSGSGGGGGDGGYDGEQQQQQQPRAGGGREVIVSGITGLSKAEREERAERRRSGASGRKESLRGGIVSATLTATMGQTAKQQRGSTMLSVASEPKGSGGCSQAVADGCSGNEVTMPSLPALSSSKPPGHHKPSTSQGSWGFDAVFGVVGSSGNQGGAAAAASSNSRNPSVGEGTIVEELESGGGSDFRTSSRRGSAAAAANASANANNTTYSRRSSSALSSKASEGKRLPGRPSTGRGGGGSSGTEVERLRKMPDFFGRGIFQLVLHDPSTAHQLLKYCEMRHCAENVEFLQKVEHYDALLHDLATTLAAIQRDFISESSPSQLNVRGSLTTKVQAGLRSIVASTLPSMEALFREVQDSIEELVYRDVYPGFVRQQLALSASHALAVDRLRYQGLGDCFCLTDARMPDVPITLASDGFVEVTGYSRTEIIPKNCRFLQGSRTDREPVARLRVAIEHKTESVELLLNYKKSGEPFWNLLYIAPLFDEKGDIAFFLGGQVNCSTTIQTSADALSVLATSREMPTLASSSSGNPPLTNGGAAADSASTAGAPTVATSPPSTASGAGASATPSQQQHPQRFRGAGRALLKALGLRADGSSSSSSGGGAGSGQTVSPGMEYKVLERMVGKDVEAQMREFYSAYSQYIVLDADLIIRFYSADITEMLHPANNVAGTIVGTPIFSFLRQNSLASGPSVAFTTHNTSSATAGAAAGINGHTSESASSSAAPHEKSTSSSSHILSLPRLASFGVGGGGDKGGGEKQKDGGGDGASGLSNEGRNRVKAAMKAGDCVGVDVRLQTRRSAVFRGDERFVTYWTPLKDERGKVGFVVVTLASSVM